MRNKKQTRTQREILADIRELEEELETARAEDERSQPEDLELMIRAALRNHARSRKDKWKAGKGPQELKKGCRVEIVIKGEYYGRQGTLGDPRGEKKLFYWITLDQKGSESMPKEIYKKPTSFKVIDD